jgi:hypothetical protein
MTEELPNPMQYSAAAGSVVCNGEERSVYISPDGGAPLIQLFEQTGEPWNASSVGENPADQTLFNEVLNTKRNETAAGYDVLVRLGCIGLEQ